MRPLLAIVAACAMYVMHMVSRQTIEIVSARHLLPRWDLATHLVHGWVDYHLLVTGQLHRLLWDLWNQGYWPPGLSLFQVPFYLALGGELTSGLWSAAAAFVLVASVGSAVLWRQWRGAAWLPASLFLALLVSSPFLLAYATVTMTEMLGAAGQLLVVLAYVSDRQRPAPGTARLFALSLTALFFIKYNYFVMVAVPLVLHDWLERTSGRTASSRIASLGGWSRRVIRSPTGAFVALYVAALVIILSTGGVEFRWLGQRISVRSIGNSGHIVLYVLLARLWWLHRRGRIDWARITGFDPRIRPLLVWFAVPVAIWLASPYPNHIRDVANLVINRPLGDATVSAGTASYLDALRGSYFYAEWVLVCVVTAFIMAALMYRRQPPLMRLLILAIPLQFAAITLHQTRFPRFLLLTVVLLCLAAASEVGRWVAGSRRVRTAAALAALLVLAFGVAAARRVVTEDRFRAVAFEHYTESPALRQALAVIRRDLTADDRLVILGQSNDLSPGLLRWELGPPSGVPCFPFDAAGAARLPLRSATRILFVAPHGERPASIDVAPARLQEALDAVDRREFALRRELPVPDRHAALRLYGRTGRPDAVVECR